MRKLDTYIIVDTARLELRPVSDKYKVEMCNEFTAEVTRFMPFNPSGDIKATEAFLENSLQELKDGKSIQFCILDKERNAFLGCCGIHNINTSVIEIGLWIKKAAQSKGYGSETVKALIELCEQNFDFNYLVYPVDKDNLASRKIPVKYGFELADEYTVKKSDTEILNVLEYRKHKHGI